jgi:quercetin dioxygenase-like cupin family protein
MPSRTIENPVQKDVATFVETSSETGGAKSVIDVDVAPGGRVRPHYHHDFDEEIVAVDGPIEVTAGGRKILLRQGERYVVPRGVTHTWANVSERAIRFRAILVPGHRGFENFLRLAYGLARDGKVKADGTPSAFGDLAVLLTWGDTNIPGVMGVLNPVLRWRARKAEASGRAGELRARYDCE